MMSPMRIGVFLSHYRRIAGILAVLVYVAAVEPTDLVLIVSAIPIIAGVALRMWAAGLLQADVELASRGPYSIVRHPFDFGVFLIGAGLAMMSGGLSLPFLFAAGFLWITIPALQRQERRLVSTFGDAATDYFRRVPRFLPVLDRYEPPATRWSPQVALLENRQWRMLVLIAALWLFGYAHRIG